MQRLFSSHILPLLQKHRPKKILEIGVLKGENTLRLLEWCQNNNAVLTSLDPVPWQGDLPEEVKRGLDHYEYKRAQEGFEDWAITPTGLEEVFRKGLQKRWVCRKIRSEDFLSSAEYEGADFCLIDGDHNYYTVCRELTLLHKKGKKGDVILLHDVGEVPHARKDMYYDSDFIPFDYLDGPHQGVLTAVEDFLASFEPQSFLGLKWGCAYSFKVLTTEHFGLGRLLRKRD